MELIVVRISVIIVVLLSCFCSDFGSAADAITSSHFIRDHESIISNGSTFRLGFFSPGNSTNRYVGIWYNDASENVIWVANRNNPLDDSSGMFTIYEDGNLVVLNGQKQVLWSSNVANSIINTSAQLLESGNLVLNGSSSGISLWESFQEPTDTFLTSMKLSTNLRTGKKVQLTTWKSPSDPSIGSFSAGIDALNFPQVFIWNDNLPYWRSGPWNGRIFIGTPNMNSGNADRFDFGVDNEEGITYLTSSLTNPMSYVILNSQGKLVKTNRVEGKKDWEVRSSIPETECDVYNKCGAFGRCNSEEKQICSCLGGFEPMNAAEWNRGNWTSGCVRRKPLQCERISTTGEVGKEDGFLKLGMMKLPDFAERSSALENECRDKCLNNCSCIAYAYDAGIGCMQWRENLIDMQRFSKGGINLYIRLAHSELDNKDMKVVIIIPVVVGTVVIAICAFFTWRWREKRKALKGRNGMLQFARGEAYPKSSSQSMNRVELQDLPVFTFEELAIATNNFSLTNKLGQGGFGPVYRGKLQDGQEIAVKRLSKASGQGLDEFMNEVVVISRLQHRNLVRLLGCCIEREEKMLIYEYMPNKSLDTFLFDPLKKVLDWRKRVNIIEGISRGLLYLHRDSRLRIIHRDLKTSNILLDEELNPKISDFGMARIFGGNQDQANTIRVAGTYGYMSPEYAMEGRFSEKSDVFSFGVLLLEIVSGRRNTSFYHDEDCLNLLSYAWKLWNENKITSLVDPVISESAFDLEIIRCIHVGLLCVQEFVRDRPTMSTVISMINSEIVDLPAPKQPAFTERRSAFNSESSEQSQQRCSVNNVTVTIIEAR